MSHIFISYAREDNKIAEKIYSDLKKLNAQPWMDKYNLVPGQGWRGVIKNAIRHSSHFIMLISKNSIRKRGYAQREIVEAIEYLKEIPPDEIFIIPARLDNTNPLFEEILNLNMVDLFPSYDEGFKEIRRSLKITGGVDSKINQSSKNEPLKRDIERIRAYRQLFDRPAFTLPCIYEYALLEVISAMEDISAALATGTLNSRSGKLLKNICPIGEFETEDFVISLNEIRGLVTDLRQFTAQFVKRLSIGENFHHMEFFLSDLFSFGISHEFMVSCFQSMDNIDIVRNQIIKKMNQLLESSLSRTLPYITISTDQLNRSAELEEKEWGGSQRWHESYLRQYKWIRKFLLEGYDNFGLESLSLSTIIISNIKRNSEIKTVRDLLSFSEKELLSKKIITQKHLKEINHVLKKRGLSLRGS